MKLSELRVIIYCDAAAARNGVGSYYVDLVDNLEDELASIRLIAPDRPPRRWLSMPLPGDRTQQIALPSLTELKRITEQERPHVAIVATPGPYGFFGARLARSRGIPILYGFHTDYVALSKLYWTRLFAWLSRSYLQRVNSILFRYADVVLAHSDHMVDMARELGARRVELAATLLPAGFDQVPAAPRGQLTKVLFVGRLAAEKRIDRLLDAARKLPDIQFSIAGRGPLSSQVEAAAASQANVHHLGWLERSAIPDCLAEHDLLVLPSDVESFGTVALEALACARPALVSDQCGIGEWPDLRAALYFFSPEQPDALADALYSIAAQPSDQQIEKALAGHRAYVQLARQGKAQWAELLRELAAPASRKPRPSHPHPTDTTGR